MEPTLPDLTVFDRTLHQRTYNCMDRSRKLSRPSRYKVPGPSLPLSFYRQLEQEFQSDSRGTVRTQRLAFRAGERRPVRSRCTDLGASRKVDIFSGALSHALI